MYWRKSFPSPSGDSSVKDLQALLFPISPRKSDSFLSNFFLKSASSPRLEIEEEHLEQVVRFKDAKEYIAKDADCPSQPPRWPTECQVLEEKIEHIDYVPAFPEPYYTPTGKEVQPKPVGEECGLVVYQYYPISAVSYFSRSSVGGSRYLLPTCPCPEEDCLRFESRFESGNLAKAIKITATYYELYLRTDLYTNKHTQWFYFRITNMRKNLMYRFSIVNLAKEESLYNEGMKLLMYSARDAQIHSIGWRRCGENITYFYNENVGPDDPEQQPLYTLTFTIEFPHDDDTVYFAHSYPYTYSDLQKYLQEMTTHPVKSTFSNLRLLCRTLAGNNVYYVTITTPQVPGDNRKKQAIVITSRVHPGETPSSWMMKGFLDFLTGDSGPAKELREKFIFKLVPMLNPDGVIVGNNRCSLTGRDLNRQYRTVIRETYPTIWYTKLMIRRLLEECGVAMYCDLHAHSRKHNIFIYGCENRRGYDKRLHEQVFPLMLHKNSADKFSFENCKFRVQKCKEGTGRVVIWMMGIANSFTMEASFAGSTLSTRMDSHFNTQDYEQMGKAFCQTLLDFYDVDPRKERLRTKIISRLVKEGSNADEPTNIKLSDYSSDSGDTSSSSEEGGGRDYEIPLIVPPPSPALMKKLPKPKNLPPAKPKQVSKSPTALRKPLPMFKANLEISFNQEKSSCYTSDSNSSNSDSDDDYKNKSKFSRRRRRKKKIAKKIVQEETIVQTDYSDTEIQLKKSSERCISVLELLPDTKARSQSWHRNTKMHKVRGLFEGRRSTAQQLAEVQAKLISLRNKLWFGIGDGEGGEPLSWGESTFRLCSSTTPQLTRNTNVTTVQNVQSKPQKKKAPKPEKESKKVTAKKSKENCKEKVPKKEKVNAGFRRQTTIEWVSLNNMSEKIKKLKTLSDTTAKFHKLVKGTAKKDSTVTVKCDPSEKLDESKQKKENKKRKKKKKNSKLEKTAKSVTNANIFIRRE